MKERQLYGQLTIFFALTMITILSLVLLLIEGARTSALRLTIASTYRTAGESVLAGYHREVFERYGIFLFDASEVEKTMTEVMKRNWEKDLAGVMLGARNLLALEIQDVQLEKVTLATDDAGKVIWRQCVLCMEEAYGVSYLKQMMELLGYVEDQGLLNQEIKIAYGEEEITHADLGEGMWDADLRKTLIPDTFSWLEREALSFLLGNEKFSQRNLIEGERVSERDLEIGEGLVEEHSFDNNHWNKLLFLEYLIDYTGNYVRQLEDGHLKYQVEYILNGCTTDGENLWETARCLLELRMGANMVGILLDEEKTLAVKDLSESLATTIGNPEVIPVIYAALLLIWAEIEGIYDVKQLLDGESVSLIKTTEEWLIDVSLLSKVAQLKEERKQNQEEAAEVQFDFFAEQKRADTEGGEKLWYEDYLRILLWLEDEEVIALRFMDIMESDIRSVTEDKDFNLNRYADRIWVRAKVLSGYGTEFSIYREYGY